MGQSRPLFVYFRSFLFTNSIIQIEKSIDGALGIRTWGRRIDVAMAAARMLNMLTAPFYFARSKSELFISL